LVIGYCLEYLEFGYWLFLEIFLKFMFDIFVIGNWLLFGILGIWLLVIGLI